jgi:hypothetical protein
VPPQFVSEAISYIIASPGSVWRNPSGKSDSEDHCDRVVHDSHQPEAPAIESPEILHTLALRARSITARRDRPKPAEFALWRLDARGGRPALISLGSRHALRKRGAECAVEGWEPERRRGLATRSAPRDAAPIADHCTGLHSVATFRSPSPTLVRRAGWHFLALVGILSPDCYPRSPGSAMS